MISDDIDPVGLRHLRFQQQTRDVPVWGHQLIVHINREEQVYRVDGEFIAGLQEIDTNPSLLREKATALAVAAMPEDNGTWQAKQASLYIYADHSKTPKLVYQVELLQGLIRQFVLIDAQNGAVLKHIEGSPTMH